MLDKILGCIVYVFMFGLIHYICRASSSYLPGNTFKKYRVIKNDLLSIILISERVSRNKVVGYHDLNKMSIVGLVSYITLEPINLYILIIRIMYYFKLGNINLDSIYNIIAYVVLAMLIFIFLIVEFVDKL